MSDVRVFKIENRLAKVVKLPGGRTVADALRSADNRVAAIRNDCIASLAAKGAQLQQQAERARSQADPAALAGVYTTANEMFGIASTFAMTELAEAAYGLCDLVDDTRTPATINWGAIDVYVNGVRFLGSEAGQVESAARSAIVAGLREVAARFVVES